MRSRSKERRDRSESPMPRSARPRRPSPEYHPRDEFRGQFSKRGGQGRAEGGKRYITNRRGAQYDVSDDDIKADSRQEL